MRMQVTRVVCLVVWLLTVPAARAQDALPRAHAHADPVFERNGISIAGSDSPDFKPLAEQFGHPELASDPTAVIVTNHTDKIVVAYSIVWAETHANGKVTRYILRPINVSYLTERTSSSAQADGDTIAPHSSRLLGRGFNIAQTAGQEPVTPHVGAKSSLNSPTTSLTVMLGGVVFQSAESIAGADDDFLPLFEASIKSQREAAEVALGLGENPERGEFERRLGTLLIDWRHQSPFTVEDQYKIWRAMTAEELINIERQRGVGAALARAKEKRLGKFAGFRPLH